METDRAVLGEAGAPPISHEAAWPPPGLVLPVLPSVLIGENSIKQYLIQCAELPGLADLLFQTEDYVFAKLNGVHRRISERRLDQAEVEAVATVTYGLSVIAKINSGEDANYRAEVPLSLTKQVAFRGNITRGRVGEVSDGLSITLRLVNDVPRRLQDMNLEQEIIDNLFPLSGLVLIVGATGSGKTTLLSAAHRYRLESRTSDPRKFISYEDPIETTYGRLGEGIMPKAFQAEMGIGRHLSDFAQAGPNAMRRGADFIQVGEMRDRKSFEAGMELAMTGHAVYATMHVETPAEAIERAVSMFPYDAQPSAASKLRSVLRMVVAQKQFPTLDGKSARVRSWCVFDRELKSVLAQLSHVQWIATIADMVRKRGADFEIQAMRYLERGLIDFESFCQVSSFTPREGREFLASKGVMHDGTMD